MCIRDRLSSANYDSPVIRRQSTVVVRSAPPVVNHVVAALSEPAPLISAPATVPPGPSLSFQDRFAAAAPQGVEPKPQAEAPKLAEAPKPPAETPKLAEAAKPQIVASLPPERQAAPAAARQRFA